MFDISKSPYHPLHLWALCPHRPQHFAEVFHRPLKSFHSVIVLRDPVARLVSFAKWSVVRLGGFSQFAAAHAINWQAMAVNGLAGVSLRSSRYASLPPLHKNFARTCIRARGGAREPRTGVEAVAVARAAITSDAEALATLKRQLAPFAVVGVTEHLIGFVWSLMAAFGWPEHVVLRVLWPGGRSRWIVPHVNESKFDASNREINYSQADVAEALQLYLYRREACDLALWIAAGMLVDERLAAVPKQYGSVADFERRIWRLQQNRAFTLSRRKCTDTTSASTYTDLTATCDSVSDHTGRCNPFAFPTPLSAPREGKPIPRPWTRWAGARGPQGPSLRPQSGHSPQASLGQSRRSARELAGAVSVV